MDLNYEILKYTHDKHPEAHIHESYEVFISLSNEGKFFVKETGYPLRPGTVFFLPPFEIHRCFCRGNREYDRYVTHFSRDRLQRLSTEQTDFVSVFDTAPLMQQLSDEMLAKSLEKLSKLTGPCPSRFAADVERNLIMDDFLLLMARVINESGSGPIPMAENNRLVNNILTYIHEHYQDEITLDELTKAFFISKSSLSQIFKDTTGFSIGDYIITYRIKRACVLLRSGLSVQDVGTMVGFHTDTNFIRMFKKRMGFSPGRFARENSSASEK